MGQESICPEKFNLRYLAKSFMPLCYDELITKDESDRIYSYFTRVFDHNNDGEIDVNKTKKFLIGEKLGLILLSARNSNIIEDGNLSQEYEYKFSEDFPTYGILVDAKLFGQSPLAPLIEPSYLFFESLIHDYENDDEAKRFKDEMWRLTLKISDMENFPYLLRFGIHGKDAIYSPYQNFTLEAFDCYRECISEDIFYLALMTLRNELNDSGAAAAIASNWGWNVGSTQEFDTKFPEFRKLFNEYGIPVSSQEKKPNVSFGSDLEVITLDKQLTKVFASQVEVYSGNLEKTHDGLKDANWTTPNTSKEVLTRAQWVKFATSKNYFSSDHHIATRVGCLPKRVIIESPQDYFTEYFIDPQLNEYRKIKDDVFESSVFPSPLSYSALGNSVNLIFLDCKDYEAAQRFLSYDEENVENLFSDEIPLFLLPDYKAYTKFENVSFVKINIALVMSVLFSLLFIYDRKRIYFLVASIFLLEIAKEIVIDWHIAALMQWTLVMYLVSLISENYEEWFVKTYNYFVWILSLSILVMIVEVTLFKMGLTDGWLFGLEMVVLPAIIMIYFIINFLGCLRARKKSNSRSLIGIVFMVPFMFDYAVILYRLVLVLLHLSETSFDMEWAFAVNVRFDEAYYELYLKVFAAALTGLILVARNDLLQRQAIEIQTKLTSAYQRFVPEEILDTLGKQSILELNIGDQIEKEMSILFSDIRGFTSTSENLSPEQNFNFVNDYLEIMVPIVRKNNGFIDKFMGDAVMAIFPREPKDAVECAIEMQAAMPSVNAKTSKYVENEIKIGIGINTGVVRFGTLGALDRMEGSVISDAVNLASRVEQLTKNYPSNIIVTEFTKVRVSGFKIVELDEVKVKGKSEKVKIFGIVN